MRLGLIGSVVAAAVVLFWLIPTVFSLVFGLIWLIVKLPFRLLRLIVVDGIGGLLMLLWRVFTGFFAIFGLPGLIAQWLVVAAAAAFAVLFLYYFFRAEK